MKSSTVSAVAILYLGSVVQGQAVPPAPDCVTRCFSIKITEAASLAPGVNPNNLPGLCATRNFVQAFANCMTNDNCPTMAESIAGVALAQMACAQAGGTLNNVGITGPLAGTFAGLTPILPVTSLAPGGTGGGGEVSSIVPIPGQTSIPGSSNGNGVSGVSAIPAATGVSASLVPNGVSGISAAPGASGAPPSSVPGAPSISLAVSRMTTSAGAPGATGIPPVSGTDTAAAAGMTTVPVAPGSGTTTGAAGAATTTGAAGATTTGPGGITGAAGNAGSAITSALGSVGSAATSTVARASATGMKTGGSLLLVALTIIFAL